MHDGGGLPWTQWDDHTIRGGLFLSGIWGGAPKTHCTVLARREGGDELGVGELIPAQCERVCMCIVSYAYKYLDTRFITLCTRLASNMFIQ